MKERDPWFLKKGESRRKWKSQKRKELKAILKAIEPYRHGCAFCAGSSLGNIMQAQAIIESMIKDHSIKTWGR